MNRVSNRHQLRLIAEIPVTPLLDLVLILLFVFLLAAPLLKQDAALAMPAAPTAGAPAKTVTLAVRQGDRITLDGVALTLAELPDRLAKLAAGTTKPGVIVQIDRVLPVHRLVQIMDMLQAAHIRQTAVTTIDDGGE